MRKGLKRRVETQDRRQTPTRERAEVRQPATSCGQEELTDGWDREGWFGEQQVALGGMGCLYWYKRATPIPTNGLAESQCRVELRTASRRITPLTYPIFV